ncbi:MAG: SMC-Scp complex subunit ScpB [bacterium]|nr:SMC-Scp complex subunit ScpB [bacterium]
MDTKQSLESILFLQGEPISVERLSKLTGKKKEQILKSLEELCEEYKERGIVVMEKNGEWQFGTNPACRELAEKFVKSEFTGELTKAALETIAIVAYKGPLTRAEIEYIRGVNSSFIVRNLLMRGLVSRKENPKDARSFIYEVSFDFLKYFGLTRMEDLPQYAELSKKEIAIPEAEDIEVPQKNSSSQQV